VRVGRFRFVDDADELIGASYRVTTVPVDGIGDSKASLAFV